MYIISHCPDGTDRNCSGAVRVDLPYTGLTSDNIQSHWTPGQHGDELESITIMPPADPRWIAENVEHLRDSDIEDIAVNGYFELEADNFPYHGVCPACGSSETTDEEGNNITAL